MSQKNKKKLSLFLSLICMLLFLTGCHKDEQETEAKIEFSFLNISAVGIYEGELNNSLADGEGIFLSTDKNKIKVSGTWEYGKLSGK